MRSACVTAAGATSGIGHRPSPIRSPTPTSSLDLPPRPDPVRPDRPLKVRTADFLGLALCPSNSAILSTMSRPEDEGIHVHGWDREGVMVLDETYSSVTIDGETVDEELLRVLAVQRALGTRCAHRRAPLSWLPDPASRVAGKLPGTVNAPPLCPLRRTGSDPAAYVRQSTS